MLILLDDDSQTDDWQTYSFQADFDVVDSYIDVPTYGFRATPSDYDDDSDPDSDVTSQNLKGKAFSDLAAVMLLLVPITIMVIVLFIISRKYFVVFRLKKDSMSKKSN